MIETTMLTKEGSKVRHRGRSLRSPVHWMIVSTLTTCLSGRRAGYRSKEKYVRTEGILGSSSRRDLCICLLRERITN